MTKRFRALAVTAPLLLAGLPVAAQALHGSAAVTDRGGTVTAGGTAQTLAPANPARKAVVIQNPCTAAGQGIGAAEDLYISVAGNATVAGSGNYADLASCGSASVTVNGEVYTGAISVNAATTGHRWMATEWQ